MVKRVVREMPSEGPCENELLERLRSEIAKINKAVEASGACLWDWRLDTDRLDVNEGWAALIGYSREELEPITFKTWEGLVHPDDRPLAMEALRKHLSGETAVYECEIRLRHRDGRWIWVLDRGMVVERAPGGEAVRMTGAHLDISAKKEMERMLAASERRYRSMFESSGSANTVFDRECRLIMQNEVARRALGLEGDSAIGMGAGELAGSRGAEVEERMRRVMESGVSEAFQTEFLLPSGVKWYFSVYQPIRDDAGAVTGLMVISRDITEKANVERSLREKDLALELALRSSGMGVWTYRVARDQGAFDLQACALLGIGPELASGKAMEFLSAVHPDDRRLVADLLKRTIRSGAPYEPDFRVEVPDGGLRHLRARGALLRGPDGRPDRVVGVLWDDSARKAQEKALDEERDLFKGVMETSPVGIVILDPAGEMIFANRRAVEILGLTGNADERRSYNAPAWKIAANDGSDFPDEELPFQRVRSTGKSVIGVEHAIKWPNGTLVLLSVNAAPIFDKAGALSGVVTAIEDITGRKRAELAMIKSEDRYRSLFLEMREGFALHEIVADEAGAPADYRFLSVNPAFERLTGLKAEDIVGKRARSVIPGLEASWIERYGRVALSGQPETFEDYSGDLDRHYRVVAYCPGAGLFATLIEDITERKRLAETLERGQRLESLGLLAGGIAHDFNNLLAGIFGYVESAMGALGQGRAEKARADLEKTVGVFERAKGLTRQLLTFAKGGAPVRSLVDLGPLVGKSVSFALSGSKVTGRVSIPEGLWPCECDATQVGQVIDNIVINAVQAMPGGGGLTVTAANVPDALGEGVPAVMVSLSDEGIGMTPEVLARAFDPFFTTKETGHGLGLATAYSIVKRHGGRLEASSEPGKGTSFEIYLPASRAKSAEAVAPSAARSRASPSGAVLILDDEDFIRDILGSMLEEIGYRVEAASDGEEALRLFEAANARGEPHKVCILDLTIPGGFGGREACARMRLSRRDAVIVASSGYSEDPVMARPREFGFSESISKPYTERELRALFSRLFP